jgi:DNA-directed RNA polymerase specialized sigma24 family protein
VTKKNQSPASRVPSAPQPLVPATTQDFLATYLKFRDKLANKYQSEDCIQDAILSIVQAIDSGIIISNRPGVLYNYLKKTAHNIKMNTDAHWDKNKMFSKRLAGSEPVVVDNRTPEFLVLKKEEATKLQAFVNTQPPERQKQLKAFLAHETIREAATAVKVNYTTVKTNIRLSAKRALQELETPITPDTVFGVLLAASDESFDGGTRLTAATITEGALSGHKQQLFKRKFGTVKRKTLRRT